MTYEPEAKRARLDPDRAGPTGNIPLSPKIAAHVMTLQNKKLLLEQCGTTVEWDATTEKALLWGSSEQVKSCIRVLNRISSHCTWGSSEDKVSRIIKPRKVEAVLVRLSPMGRLPSHEKRLTASTPQLTIGKEKGANDVFVADNAVSRQHCILEFDLSKGAVYVLDTSTNGTYLNGVRLPQKMTGKVILSHGDDLVLKDLKTDPAQEFGWIVNIEEITVGKEVILQAPRRLLTEAERAGAIPGSGGSIGGMLDTMRNSVSSGTIH